MRHTGIIAAAALALGCGSNPYDMGSGGGMVTCTVGNSMPTTSVTIQGMAFSPQCIRVAPGAVVTFTNADAVAHSATADTGGTFDTGLFTTPAKMVTAPMPAGTYPYHCTSHPTMHGGIVVQ